MGESWGWAVVAVQVVMFAGIAWDARRWWRRLAEWEARLDRLTAAEGGGRTVEFEGSPSGDCECFCWDVDRDTYVRVSGDADPEDFEVVGYDTAGEAVCKPLTVYRLYPIYLPLHGYPRPRRVRVRVTVWPVEPGEVAGG